MQRLRHDGGLSRSRDGEAKFSDRRTGILAWGAIKGEVQVVPGGYRAHGRWDFASGSRQASWLGAHVQVVEADGKRRLKPNGAPEIRTILFPLASATMYDVWDVIGLRGTGTDSYSVDNLFVPDRFSALRDDATRCSKRARSTSSPPISYSRWVLRRSRSASPAPRSTPPSTFPQQDPAGPQGDAREQRGAGPIGRTEGNLRAARAYLYATAARCGAISSTPANITEQHRIALRLAATWTIHQSAAVVDTAYHMAGATAVFAANKFERRFRDMHAIAQQIQARDTHYEDVGRAILAANPNAAAAVT